MLPLSIVKIKNHTFVELKAEEIDKWRAKVRKPVIEQWVKDTDKQGLPGKKVYEALLKLIPTQER